MSLQKQDCTSTVAPHIQFQEFVQSEATKFEEYQQRCIAKLDAGWAKMEEDREFLQSEKYKMLKDRSSNDEKDSRMGLLNAQLDEKESKFRQEFASLSEQQEQWVRQIADLQV